MQEEKLTGASLPLQEESFRSRYRGYIRHKRIVIAVLAILVAVIAVALMRMGSL